MKCRKQQNGPPKAQNKLAIVLPDAGFLHSHALVYLGA